MKKSLFISVFACFIFFVSCESFNVTHTGDSTKSLYAVWKLETKTEMSGNSNANQKEENYSKFHFYLTFGEFPFPHAIAKKGSFTMFDLKDVDIDGVRFSYDADKRQISFNKALWLSEGLLYHMRLSGTFDVLELTDRKLVLMQEALGVKTVYSYRKYE